MVALLVPRIDSAAPIVISQARGSPPNIAAASATGVADSASADSVPCATSCTAAYSAVTRAIIATSANGTLRRGLRYSPAATDRFSKPA